MTFGRGGAGNKTRPPPPTSITTTTRLTDDSRYTHSNHAFTTGRGGAGNLHPSGDERPMFRFDEELERDRVRGEVAPVYHVGRGGSGNAVKERRESEGSSSSGSDRSSKRGSLEWMRGVVKKI